jgi:hypothetical protein
VYQILQSSGGVANATPDLEACIIGPAYNKLTYIPGDVSSQVKTAAHATTSTTGSITSGLYALTVASTGGFSDGDVVLVVGAGASGENLQATITDITGNVITLDTAASTTVSSAVVTRAGKIVNSAIQNTFKISGEKPGQEVEASSVKVWLNNTRVETLVSGFSGRYLSNLISMENPSGITCDATGAAVTLIPDVGSTTLGFVEGDSITIVGAGVAGADLVTTIASITGNSATISPSASTVVTGAAVTKNVPANLNSTTNTLRVEAGDDVVVSYVNNASVSTTFTTSVRTVTTSSGLNGTITQLELIDSLPSNVSVSTTGTISISTNSLTLASATGIAIGDTLTVYGAGAGGAPLTARVQNLVGLVATLSTTAITGASGTLVLKTNHVSISVRKTYNNQQLPATKPISGGSNYSTSTVATDGHVVIQANPEVSYGVVVTGDVYIGYRALRQDLSGIVQTINNSDELLGLLGKAESDNPLALGVQIALANTVGRIRAIAIQSNDMAGYMDALDIAEGERLYALVPLTQDESILAILKAHADQMSTPENASWRVAIVNSEVPVEEDVGQYSESYRNTDAGNQITLVGSDYVLVSPTSTFISDGVVPGDTLNVYTGSTQSGAHTIQEVVSNQQLIISATGTDISNVEIWVTRSLTKTQSAQRIAAKSETFGDKRVWYIQPDIVGIIIDGVINYLPGYYLCCGLAGMVAGFPVQQGFTNIGVAGIADLKHSNFYFSKADLNTMAESGVMLFVQDTQGGIPYCRHELTTDVSVLEYREALVVKNWDFLSYFYYDKLKGFIGSWNITTDTINTIRQTIIAASELVKSKKLPKIGAPLLGYNIQKLEQNKYNKDNLDVELLISVVYPLNYLNLYLII